jgi:hypothetical protein
MACSGTALLFTLLLLDIVLTSFHLVPHFGLEQGWANFFVGGPNEKSKISGGPT